MKYKQLTVKERETIQEMLWHKQSVRAIAKALGRRPSSISREITRNQTPKKQLYRPRLAHDKAVARRSNRGSRRPDSNDRLRTYTVAKLKLGWSPEQIAARSWELTGTSISYGTTCQYIYAQIHRAGRGYVKPGKEDLRPYLARRHSRRLKQGHRKPRRTCKRPLPSIGDRPEEGLERRVVGHWEDDSIVYTPSCPVRLRTTNDLLSGVVLIGRTEHSAMADANRITKQRLGSLPPEPRKTLTRDRGANENINGLIRMF